MNFIGSILQGIVLGSLTALTAMGLVLVYRSARVVNFAQAEMGGLAAAAAVEASIAFGLPYPACFAIGVAVALATGALVDLCVVRPLAHAPRLVLTVATIGIAQLIGAGEVGLPSWFPATRSVQAFGLPWQVHISVGGYVFTADHVFTVAVAVGCMAGLWSYLERTDRGAAMQAAADSRERAVLLGIRVRALSLATWSVAAVLSGIGAILAQPILGSSLGQTVRPSTLLPPLAAAVIARMRNIRVAMVASLGIGVFEQMVLWGTHQSRPAVDVAMFILILLVLLAQSKAVTRTDEEGELGDFEALQQIRRLVRELSDTARVRSMTVAAMVIAAAVALGGPLFLSRSQLFLVANMAIFAIVAISLTVLTGWAGQISLGQFAFGGIGGALTASVMVHWHVDLPVGLAIGSLAGAAIAVVVGLPALRIPGLMLAVTTLAFAVPVSTYVLGSSRFGWLETVRVPRPDLFGKLDLGSQRNFYLFTLACLVGVAYLARNLRLSRTGRAILAVRDNPEAAASYGIAPIRARLTAFAVSGAFAGVAGGLYVIGLGGIGAGSAGIDPELSLMVFTMVVIGGTGSLLGAVLGAAYVEAAVFYLSPGWQLFATGLGLLVLLVVLPRGLGGVAYAVRDRIVERVARPRAQRAPRRRDSLLSRAALAMREIELAIPDRQREKFVRRVGDAGIASGSELMGCTAIRAGYARTEVLHGVSLSIGPGEIVALLGPNGSGKTTLLRVIAGLTRPQSGAVRYRGRRLGRYATVRRVEQGVVTVLGGRSIFPSLSVERNLRMGAWLLRDDPEAVTRGIEWVLGLFPPLARRLDTRAGLLSGGEQQMLSLAQALLCRPKVLLVDEMSLGLAPMVVQELLGVLRELAASGVGILMVEQSLNVATAIADRVALLERGVLVFSGPTPNLSDRPDLLRSVFLRSSSEAASRLLPASPKIPAALPARLPALSLRGVCKSYGGIRALDDVNLVLPAGTVLGLVGPNGSGKTTLLDVCSGFLEPEHGRVGIFGREVTELSPAQRSVLGVGRVFQKPQLFPTLTVTETVCVALERRIPLKDPLASALRVHDAAVSEREVQAMADAALAEVGLTPWRDHLVSELSTGLRRLLEIACVLAHRPRLLLLDEPSAGIAQRERGPLGEVILGLKESTGATFVVVEHDVPLISRIADQVACMNLGSLIAWGTPDQVFSDQRVIDSYLGTATG